MYEINNIPHFFYKMVWCWTAILGIIISIFKVKIYVKYLYAIISDLNVWVYPYLH